MARSLSCPCAAPLGVVDHVKYEAVFLEQVQALPARLMQVVDALLQAQAGILVKGR